MKNNTSEQEKNSTLYSKQEINWEKASHIATTLSSISVVIAIVTLAISMYPQLIWKNTNHIEKANSGDIYSQIFLADHYYEIGEYNDAIYWYKVASTTKNHNLSYIAYNNLGFLYAKGYGISDFNEDWYRLEKALSLFIKAAKYSKTAIDNLCILLKTSSRNDFPNISNTQYEELLLQYDINNSIESISYEYSDISLGPILWKDNKKYVGGQYVLESNGIGKYFYRVYTYKESNVVLEQYKYIPPDKYNINK